MPTICKYSRELTYLLTSGHLKGEPQDQMKLLALRKVMVELGGGGLAVTPWALAHDALLPLSRTKPADFPQDSVSSSVPLPPCDNLCQ